MVELDLWDQFKYKVIPVIDGVPKRATPWILVCFSCQNERQGTYCQAFNIIKGVSSGKCRECLDYKPNSGQFKPNQTPHNKNKEHKYHRSFDRNIKIMHYRHVFKEFVFDSEVRLKMRLAKLGKTGPLASRWDGGKSKENKLLRSRDCYKQLRKKIFHRDNYTCTICSATKCYIEMDHIKEWCNYPELRYEETNLRTLCKPCHKKTINYGSKAKRLK